MLSQARSTPEFDVAELSVVITGGARGIGAAIVRALLDRGAKVTTLDVLPSESVHPMLVSVEGDVTRPEAHSATVAAAIDRFGRIDAFIANAGVHDGGCAIDDLGGADLAGLARTVFETNVLGFILGLQATLAHLRDARGSVIATLSDAAFEAGNVGAGPCYTASKAAGLGLVRHFAHQYAPHVRINAVAPGGVATGLRAVAGSGNARTVVSDHDAFDERVRTKNPLGIVLSADDVAAYYLFLLSDVASGLTGEVLRPDGGLSVGRKRDEQSDPA